MAMKLCRQFSALSRPDRPVVLAAGFFDGVHLGHQALLRRAVAAARRLGGAAWMLTFDTHPLKVLAPESAPQLLTAMPHKLRLCAALGLEGCVALPFTEALAGREPEEFIAGVAAEVPRLAAICVGENWTFGRDGRGRPELLRALARQYGFRALISPSVRRLGAPVSSTRIRRAVAAGRLADVAAMLGRPFSLLGTVAPGNGVGRRLGVPTANLATADEARPPSGVYAVRLLLGRRQLMGIANVGHRPTLAPVSAPRNLPTLLEAHIFDFNEDIYDREMEVVFLRRIRPERRFDSLELLRRQIERDIRRVRASLYREEGSGFGVQAKKSR